MATDIIFKYGSQNVSKTVNENQKVDKSLDGVSKSSDKAKDSFGKLWQKMAAGAAAALAIKSVFNATDEFNKALGNLETLGPGVTAEIGNIEQGFLDIAGPLGSLEELTTAAYDAISGGVEPANVVKFMADTAAFAKGNMVQLGSAVDVTTTILNTYGSKAGTAAEIQNKLTIAIREGKVRGEELAASMGGIAATAEKVGISFDDLNAFFIASTAGGIKFSESVSAMKAVIANVAKPTADAQKAAEGMAGGFSLASLQSQGLSGFLKSMTEHVAGNTQKQKDLFGSVEAFNAIAVVTSEKGAKKMNDAQIALANSGNAAREAFEKQELTIEGLKNEIEATFVKAFLPVLRDFLKFINDNKTYIIAFFNGIVDAIKIIGQVVGTAIQAVIGLADAVIKYNPGIKLIIQGWQNLIIAFGDQLSRVEDQQIAAIIRLNDVEQTSIEKFRNFRDEIQLSKEKLREMTTDFQNVEDVGIRYNKIMQAIRDGKYGEELASDFKKWNAENLEARKKTDDTKNAVDKLSISQNIMKNNISGTVDAIKSFNEISVPMTNAAKTYGIDLLPNINDELNRQLNLIPDLNLQYIEQATETDLLNIKLKELDEQLKIIYEGLNEIDTILKTLDFGDLGDKISNFLKGGADIAAGIAKFETDPLGGLTSIIAGIGKLASVLGGTNWEAQGKAFNAALGGLIPPDMMDEFIALGKEMGNFTDAWREMIDEVIAVSDIETGADMFEWIQELSRQIKGLASGGGDIEAMGDAFAALAAKGSENLGYLGRDFQMLISAIHGTGQEMEALTNFLENEATDGLAGYIAMMDAGFTDTVIPHWEDAWDWQNKLADNDAIVQGIQGMIDATQAWGNLNKNVYQDDLALFMAQTSDAYDALIGQGFSAGESIELLVPQLQTLNQMASDYNLILDAGTQALIDQAIEAGYNMDVQESSQSIMKKGFEDLVGAIGDLTRAITGDLNDSIVGIGKTTIDITDTINARWTDAGSQILGVFDDVAEGYENLSDYVNNTSINIPAGGGGGIPGFQHGADFIVPPGYPNDSFLMGATSGERVTVEPHPALQTVSNNSNMNFSVTIMAAPGGDTIQSLAEKFLSAWRYNISNIQGKVKEKVQ